MRRKAAFPPAAAMANKSDKGEDRCFFRDSGLHGVKYLREPGLQRLVWLLVTAASCTITFFFFRGTMTEYMNENTKVKKTFRT